MKTEYRFSASLPLVAALLASGLSAAPDRSGPHFPFTFEQNEGQAAESVRFLARGEGYALFLTDDEAVVSLSRADGNRHVVRVRPAGGSAPEMIVPEGTALHHTSYLVGDDPAAWRRAVPHFDRVRYVSVYEGVDLVYHSQAGALEYDFVVAPGADASAIGLTFAGVEGLRVADNGDLELDLGEGVLTHRAPVAYQEVSGERRAVEVAYAIEEARVGFRLGAYDRSAPLVIDPVMVYSTFVGGALHDVVHDVATNESAAVYLVGETTSVDFPVVGEGITELQGALTYGFVTKLNAAGDGIEYSSILGGSSSTKVYGVAADEAGHAYVTGTTGAQNFPLVNPVQTTQPGLNIGFVAKLSPAGDEVLFSTYFGGERNDDLNAIAVDLSGAIHVAGRGTSTTIAHTNALQATFGGDTDILVAKYEAPGYRLAYSTYLGKSGLEYATGVAADVSGATYITGAARGESLGTPGAFAENPHGGYDAFVAKVARDGSAVEWFSYFGAQGDDEGRAIAIDVDRRIWIGGSTYSQGFPTSPDAVQKSFLGGTDGFAVRFSPSGSTVTYSTLLGGSAPGSAVVESVEAITLDWGGNIYLAGTTNSVDFPMVRPLQQHAGGADAFLVKLNPMADVIEYSTLLGGTADDRAAGLAVDWMGGAYVGGRTASADYPLEKPVRASFAGSEEGFLSKVCDPILSATPTTLSFHYRDDEPLPSPQSTLIAACAPIAYSIEVEGAFIKEAPAGGVTNGPIELAVAPLRLAPGVHEGKLILTSPDAVNTLEVYVTLTIAPPMPELPAEGVVNGASGAGGAVAPGEVLALYGQNMGPSVLVPARLDEQGRVATELAGTRVFFDDMPAPMLYTSAFQASVIAPYGIAGRQTVEIRVERFGVQSLGATLPVTDAKPGVFTLDSSGGGQGAILDAQYRLNGPGNPARSGDTVLVWATGEGETDPAGVDGAPATGALARPRLPVRVTVGGVAAEVDYAGAAPGMVAGVMQLNVRIPPGVPAGPAELVVTVGERMSADGVTVAVE